MSMPFITIVIPIRNEEKYIRPCLQSILQQDYPLELIEVLIIDGASEDRTPEIVREFARIYPQVKLLYNSRLIPPSAMNQAVKIARGELIIRLDAHCEYSEDYIRRCVVMSIKTGAMNVGGLLINRPGTNSYLGQAVSMVESHKFGFGGARFRVGGSAGTVDTVPFGCFKKEVFNIIGLMDERLPRNHDYEFNSRIRMSGGNIYFNPQIRFRYYSRPTISKFLHKVWQDGYEHFLVFRINPLAFSVRHWIPAGFVFGLLAFIPVGLFYSFFLAVSLLIFGTYVLLSFIAAAQIGCQKGWKYAWIIPPLFFLIHTAYGIATLIGVLRFSILGVPPKLPESEPTIHPVMNAQAGPRQVAGFQ